MTRGSKPRTKIDPLQDPEGLLGISDMILPRIHAEDSQIGRLLSSILGVFSSLLFVLFLFRRRFL